jgi:4-alpha-glucanotransferase
LTRRAGVLLHPTSLPGGGGCGSIGGPLLEAWLDWMVAAGLSIWQVLPLGPVGPDGSPYSSASAFARGDHLLSIDDLVHAGWLAARDVPRFVGDERRVDFAAVLAWRRPILDLAADAVAASVDLAAFEAAHPWVGTWAAFRAIAQVHGDDWTAWTAPLRDRDPAALAAIPGTERARAVALQWLFASQWDRLARAARRRGIALWGDLPIFVGGASADAWARRELFRLDATGHPTVVSGVPPDEFTALGQRWGHPLYDEAAQAADGYRWWGDRLAAILELVDAVRVDHFRGLAACWEVPADAPDASKGRWIPGPGQPLMDALRARFAELPLVAEDLGFITPDVVDLRDRNGLPGMAILTFALGDATGAHEHLPHRHRHAMVVYPGTHDNDPVVAWFAALSATERADVLRYLGSTGAHIARDVVRAGMTSIADTTIASLQDLLGLGADARMNVPGRAAGNWGWRCDPRAVSSAVAADLRHLVRVSGRLPPTASGMLPPEGAR